MTIANSLLPLTNAQRFERFGRFKFRAEGTIANPEKIIILESWAQREIADVRLPQHVAYGRFSGQRMNVNHRSVESLLRLWEDWAKDGHLEGKDALVQTFNGAWVARFKRQRGSVTDRIQLCKKLGAASLSNHSWGTAFDINAQLWPLGKTVPQDAPFRELFVRAREREWFPGGDFKSRPDGMHFEHSPPKRIAVQVHGVV